MAVIAEGEIDLRLSPATQSRLESDLNSTLNRASKTAGTQSAGTFGKSFAGALGGVAAFSAIRSGFHFLADSVSEFTDKAKGLAQTEAVLKSTGGVAGVTSDHIAKLTTRLGNLAAIDDDVVRGGTNVLLTFTNITNQAGKGNDIFDQATEAALNLSVALGTDLQSSVIQVGKALNDPIKGVTALQRVGVSFTASQKDQIKTLVETGRTLEAQKIILGELKTEFGGVAEAVGDSLAGKVQRASVAFGDLKENIGAGLAPILEKSVPLVAALATGVSNISPEIIQVSVAFGGLIAAGAVFIRLKGLIDSTTGSLSQMGKAGEIASTGLGVLGRVAGVAAIVGVLGVAADELKKKLLDLKPDADGAASAVLDFGKGSATLSDILRSGGVKESIDELARNARAFGGDIGASTGSLSGFRSGLAGVIDQVKDGRLIQGLDQTGDRLNFFRDKLDGVDKGLATLASSSPANAAIAADAAIQLATALNLTQGEGGESSKVLDDYATAVEKSGLVAKISATDTQAGADGIGGLGTAADEAATKVKTLDDEIKLLSDSISTGALGQFTSAEQAALRFTEAGTKLAEQLAKTPEGLRRNTEEGRALEEQLLTTVAAAQSFVEGQVRIGTVSQDTASFQAAFIEQLRGLEQQFPALRGQIDLYIAKVSSAPTELKLTGDPSGALDAINRVNNTPLPHKTLVITPEFRDASGHITAASLLGPILGGRAGGGDVGPGSWIVGEGGRELLTLGRNGKGFVTSHSETERILDRGNSSTTITVIDNTGDPEATAHSVAMRLGTAARR